MQAIAVSGTSGFGDMLGLFGSAVVVIILIAAWAILASSRFVQGGIVERPERVPQLYGYSVCLVTLIWAIVSAVSLVDASLTLNAPLYHGERSFMPFEPSLSSFEAFRSTYDLSRRMGNPGSRPSSVDSIAEPELRRRYEALRADRIERNTTEARRSIIMSMISLLIAAVLFTLHWRWLRRIAGAMPAGTTRTDI